MANSNRSPLIIDTDCGVDDAEAIMLALSSADWEVLGITCVQGNTTLENVTGNVLRVLKICEREDVPVFIGSQTSLLGQDPIRSGHVHGEDGFGGIAHTIPIDRDKLRNENAAQWLASIVKSRPMEITLVSLGPLTNLALAQRLWPDFGNSLKRLYAMGGNYTGKGNSTVAAEFNIGTDPEAAFVVLNEFKCPIHLITFDTCTAHHLPWDWYHRWINSSTSSKCQFISRLLEFRTKNYASVLPGYHSCDLMAMAIALNPEAVLLKSLYLYVTVELTGTLTKGQCVVDWNNKLGRQPNVHLAMELDKNIMCEMFDRMVA